MSETYRVWCPYQGETEDDATSVEAASPNEAAKKWAAAYDKADYTYSIACDDNSETVCVRADGDTTRWLVWGQMMPTYYAEESEEEE